MAIGQRFELLDAQSYIGQDVLNVFYYKQTGGVAGGAADLRTAFQANVLPAITSIQNQSLTHVSLATRNLDDPTDFDVLVFAVPPPGTYLNPPGPPFIAAAFMYHRATLAVRNGWKRFAGVPNNEIETGTASAAYIAACAAITDELQGTIFGPGGDAYTPQIMRKVFNPATGITTYTEFPLVSVSFRGIGSQNTRKIGAGS